VIISRTPLRISLMGGGSDLPAYYRVRPGAVVNTTIDKYVYITVNRAFDERIRASYSKTEIVDHVDKVAHPLIREAMKLTGVVQGVEITSIADIPSRGTGLGSSSAYLVGLLHALWAYQGVFRSHNSLAEEACRIELERLGEPIGKQDQYIAAYGGLQHIRFLSDESVFVDPVICTKETRATLGERLMLFYTGITRSASEILARQNAETPGKLDAIAEMVAMTEQVNATLREGRNLDCIGALLHCAWEIKRGLAQGITSAEVDEMYEAARRAGALGGKLTGAGGGGFLLLWVEPQNQGRVRQALGHLRELPLRLEPQGSKIIYIEE
jgi:D-glycero-alpha-D-manno-heptose-7-phosphate kinase